MGGAAPGGYRSRRASQVLHRLPLSADGFDIFTRGRCPLCTPEMGGDYPGYDADDFPVSTQAREHSVFLPLLSDPVEDAAGRVVAAIRRVAARAGQ